MRKWYRYTLNFENNQRFFPKDETYNNHKKSLEGYETDRSYDSKKDFFNIYFYNSPNTLRFTQYHDYLKQNLKKEESILSIGSGRCVNEISLIEDGFNITCSDLEESYSSKTPKIFPNLRFVRHDIKLAPFEYKFDCIISLSMFYLFDEKDLLVVFKNVAKSLNAGGKFIFDPGGSEDNLFTYLLDEFICKFETIMSCLINRFARKKQCVIARKHRGYRNKNNEIISIAKKAGFVLQELVSKDYITEVSARSVLLGKLPKKVITRIGRAIPYVRIFNFVKEDKDAD